MARSILDVRAPGQYGGPTRGVRSEGLLGAAHRAPRRGRRRACRRACARAAGRPPDPSAASASTAAMRRRHDSSPSTGASAAAIAGAWPGRVPVDARGGERGGGRQRGRSHRRPRRRFAPASPVRRPAWRARAGPPPGVSASASSSSAASLSAIGCTTSRAAAAVSGAERDVGFGRERAQRRARRAGCRAPPALRGARRRRAPSASASRSCSSRVCPRQRGVRSAAAAAPAAASSASTSICGPASCRASSGGAAAACHAASASSGTLASAQREAAGQQRAREQRRAAPRGSRDHASASAAACASSGSPESSSSSSGGDALSRAAALRGGRVAEADDGRAPHLGRPPRIGRQREQRLQRSGARLAAEAEAGGCDDLGLSVVEGLDQLGRRRRVGKASQAPDRDGPKPVVAVGAGEARERRARPRIAESRQRGQRRELQVEPRRGVAMTACAAPHFQLDAGRRAGRGAHPSRERGLLVPDREPHQRRRRVAVAEHADQIDDRPVRRLVGLGDDLQQRTQHAPAERAARIVRGRVAVHRRQQPLEQRRQQLAACRRVLARPPARPRARVSSSGNRPRRSASSSARRPASVIASSSCDARNSWFSASAASCSSPRRMSSRASASVAAGFVSRATAAR